MEKQKKGHRIIVTENFDSQAEEQYNYLYDKSPQNGDKFISGISPAIKIIAKHPKTYPSEPFLPTKTNLYRFFLYMKSWKIIYKTTNDLIIFLGIIHTSQHPNKIKNLRTSNYQ
jgi:ParE toxin of type II toxin-antitoxin system, parDE